MLKRRQVGCSARVDGLVFDLRAKGDAVNQDVDGAKIARECSHHALDGVIAVLLKAFVVAGLLVDIGHGVEADVAGEHLFHFEHAGTKGQDAGIGVGIAFRGCFRRCP